MAGPGNRILVRLRRVWETLRAHTPSFSGLCGERGCRVFAKFLGEVDRDHPRPPDEANGRRDIICGEVLRQGDGSMGRCKPFICPRPGLVVGAGFEPTAERMDALIDQWQITPRLAAELVNLALCGRERFGRDWQLRITSGRRSATRQEEMQEAWDRGEREGLIVRPADPDRSHHTHGQAVDLAGTDAELAILGELWQSAGNRWGGFFLHRDPVHFDLG